MSLPWRARLVTHLFLDHTKDQNAGFRYDRNPISLILYATFFCNDTLIFLFISRKIYVDSVTSRTYTGRLKSLIKGEGLYHVSRALLQSGQLYYGSVARLMSSMAAHGHSQGYYRRPRSLVLNFVFWMAIFDTHSTDISHVIECYGVSSLSHGAALRAERTTQHCRYREHVPNGVRRTAFN